MEVNIGNVLHVVIPGVGWDNLRNLEGGLVVSYNFSKCKVTDDGQFIIPDNVFSIPIKSSRIERYAELIDTWHNASSVTSNTINIEAGMSSRTFSISGKYSDEHKELKSKQIEDKAVTVRVQLRYHRYEVKLQPDPVLSPQFKNRLLSIAAFLELNQTELARYYGQLLIRDFGTHVLTSVTAGAGLVKDDYIKSQFVLTNLEQKSSILASASASFWDTFNFTSSFGRINENKVSDSYKTAMEHSLMKTLGGPFLQLEDTSLDSWIKGVDRNLVPMDRNGDPLYFFITPQTLPELPIPTVNSLEKIVRNSVQQYYLMNTIRGCTKLGSPSFSYAANFEDGSCSASLTNLTFGGIYQTCSLSGKFLTQNPCDGLDIANPKTGTHSCPPSYTPILMQSASKIGSYEVENECRSCWIFFDCCDKVHYQATASYNTYWCAATGPVQPNSGYLFGGLYKPTMDNPVTGTTGCPPTFYPIHFLFDIFICLSDDFEQSKALSVPFGGFFSCKAGNPLATRASYPVGTDAKNSLRSYLEKLSDASSAYMMGCPEGYSQHLATVDVGCSINYCVKTGALNIQQLPPIKRPPFMAKPAFVSKDDLVIFDPDTQINLSCSTQTTSKLLISPAVVHYETHSLTFRDSQPYITRLTALHYETHSLTLRDSQSYITRLTVLHYETHSLTLRDSQSYISRLTALHYETHSLTLRDSQPYITRHTVLHYETHSLTFRDSQPYITRLTVLHYEIHSLTLRDSQSYITRLTASRYLQFKLLTTGGFWE
ncbi:Macrophage-expressed protein 1 protein [Bulinus truncatus]|nr:Macrophage-expressed protein 1 protein [Bulinus truncatus]